jgi:hypothetical protein
MLGHATAQRLVAGFPQRRPRVRFHVSPGGICGEKNGTGVAFLRVLRLPFLILFPPTAPNSLIVLSLPLHSLDTDSVVK